MSLDFMYTWVDVQAALEASVSQWPESVFSARAYWDGVAVEHAAGHEADAARLLAEQFGPRWIDDGARRIRLESAPGAPTRVLPVQLVPVDDSAPAGVARRTFRRADTAMRRKPAPLPTPALSPKIFAWHSFKGGVCRTTTAVQFARLLAKREGTSVMLVDMDFEAPGITWMTAASKMPAPPIAMSDVLALVHSTPPEQMQGTVDLIASVLRDSLVDSLVILPALRGEQRDTDIRPEHLESPGLPPLADILASVATALKVTHVIVDLRAGRSEVSASLLLDRRVARVLVTTCAGQSIKGTGEMLRDISGTFPSLDSDPAVVVLVSRVHGASAASTFADVKAELTAVIEGLLPVEETEEKAFPVRFTAALHDENLMALPLEWGAATARLDATGMLEIGHLKTDFTLAEWAEDVAPRRMMSPVAPSDINASRTKLAEFAMPLVTAEASSGGVFHDANFLKRLVEAHRSRLPIVVVVGSKGSGKTFTFLRLLANKTWREFVQASRSAADVDGAVWPVVSPRNLSDDARAIVDGALGTPGAYDRASVELREALDAPLSPPRSLSGWRDWWLERLALRAGLRSVADLAAPGVAPALFVVDGLEELFPDVLKNEGEQLCLRALFQEVPTWLRASNPSLGLIVFARPDYVRAAIPQNPDQFFTLYDRYALVWDHIEAKRLVVWIARHSGAVPPELDDDAALVRLWGRKIGSDSSREALTTTWVLDALFTRQGELQARDLVRLLAFAARGSAGAGWPDRLLAPSAIRAALKDAGREKIREIVEELPELGRALEAFKPLAGKLSVPFKYSDLNQDGDRLALTKLIEDGIAWRDQDEIWLVSLYRHGLGLPLKHRRRERVVR